MFLAESDDMHNLRKGQLNRLGQLLTRSFNESIHKGAPEFQRQLFTAYKERKKLVGEHE